MAGVRKALRGEAVLRDSRKHAGIQAVRSARIHRAREPCVVTLVRHEGRNKATGREFAADSAIVGDLR
jgi:hypothetical protein